MRTHACLSAATLTPHARARLMCTALTLRACPSARSFLCPYDGCDFASLTRDDAVWAHAEEEHGIERDSGLCLWDGCSFGRKTRTKYLAHVGQHNGVWPAYCSSLPPT